MNKAGDRIFSIERFTDDAVKYRLLKSFWADTFKELTGLDENGYVHNFYANGEEIMDGNPIFSSLYKDDKGIRIIQLDSDDEEPLFVAWTSGIELDEKRVDELVISLQLSEETFIETKRLISLFVGGALYSQLLDSINSKYELTSNLARLSKGVISSGFGTSLHELSKLNGSKILATPQVIGHFKTFNHIYSLNQSWLTVDFPSRTHVYYSYSRFISRIHRLHEMINVVNSYDIDNIESTHIYVVFENDFGSATTFATKLKRYSAQAEKEYNSLRTQLEHFSAEV